MRLFLAIIVTCAIAIGCNYSATIRDTLAVNYGFITYAQSQFKGTCVANPAQTVCQLVTKDIPLHNATIDALEAYCGGVPATDNQSFSAGGPCAPVKGLLGALQAAVAALIPVMNDLKPLINVADTKTADLPLEPNFEIAENHRLEGAF